MYKRPLALIALIAAACKDLETVLTEAEKIEPQTAQDPAGQDDANGQAADVRAAAEKRARGILDDIEAHVREARTVSWSVDVDPPAPPAPPLPPATELPPVPPAPVEPVPGVPAPEAPAAPSDTAPPSDPPVV